ncbi:TetR/AcrR family transcriptional regulator [Paenibacillus sp. Soil787]|uniref:TetR/AcrR family transcriptional regulator n=1 Tax=Paenibacillus sp. Soil787 TaxID=1736411 RepID=UPI0006FA9C98|nr:TetR/AcrR family transcriptional regulator [Paenibacillus sp. Soil787]KRF38583.1 transcriptional regulator [Paenibacillus sp. Soil787]
MDRSAISLRELKKARTKVALYEASLSLIGDKMFRDMMLDDICRKAEVSRVTFFKFFQKKEDLLVYFMRVWLTERIIEIEAEGKRGFSVIQHVLHKVAEEAEERAGLMPSLISFLVEMNMHPCMPELSEAEVLLLFPGHEEVGAQTPDMYKLFRRCMTEADTEGQLRKEFTVETAVKVLFTVFYGAFLTAQLYGSKDIKGFYNTHLQLLENR